MITTRKKFEFSLAILLTMFITVIFSIVIALSAQQVSLRGGLSISYDASPILISGLDFKETIPDDCTSIIFDYASNHEDIISSLQATPIDTKGSGLNDGGISSYYDSTNTTFYVLSDYEIYANPDCTNMFMSKSKITSIDFHNFNTSKVTSMLGMFQICSSLKSLDLSNFNTSNVEDMGCMFLLCSSLTSLDLTGFNTSNVTNMGGMFHQCSNLITLDVSSFNTSNVKGMGYMFYSCPSLTSLDLSSFNTSKVTGMYYMFQDCRTLTTIWVGEAWSVAGVTASESMFYNCDKLVGGEGTTFNSSYVDKTYARVDGGASNPGYITLSTTATLIDGSTFNSKIPSNCTEVVFDRYGLYASKFTNWSEGENVSVDDLGDVTDKIKIFEDGTKLYILSKGKIYANPDCTNMFMSKSNIISIDFHNFNTSNVTTMHGMFQICLSLKSLDLSNFNTSKVKDMSIMFLLCESLTSLDLTSFNTSNVTNMGGMFHQCSKLISLDVSSFNTSNVKGMGYIFYSCPSLTSLDLSSFNTSNVTSMYYMFSYCSSLTSIDLSGLNTYNVRYMEYMFYNCTNLKTIWVGNLWSVENVTSSDSMFSDCYLLVGGEGTTFNSSYVDKTYARVDGGPSSPGYFTLSKSATLIDGSTFNSNIPEECTSIIFDYASNYQSIASSLQATPVDVKGAGLNDGGISSYYDQSNKTLYVLSNHEIYANYDCSYIFANMLNIKNLDFSNFNTSNVENMEGMFGASQIPGSLDLSSFDTSKVTNMKQMFFMCSKLTELDLSSFNTTNVTNMGQMFHYCVGLTELDLSNFDTSKVTNMTVMFNNCSSLTELDLSSFDTSNITSMGSMFYNCSSLTELDLSSFDTSNVTNVGSMFENCTSLTELDLSGWNTSNVTSMSSMFSNCNYLKTIWVGNLWSVANVTSSSSMFSDCYLLVGGEGTKFSSSYIDKTYARVDGGSSNPGYLTLSTPATLMSGSAFNLKIQSDCTEVIFDRYGLYASKFRWTSFIDNVSVDASGNTTSEIKTFKDGTKFYVLSKGKIYANPDCSYMFYKATKILSITFNNFNTSNVTNMSNMFEIGYTYYPNGYSGSEYAAGKLENIVGLHRFNTSNVTDMSGMFYQCSELINLNLSSFNTSNVTNMGGMFFNCNNLTKLDVSNFNTSNVTNMATMFLNCSSLTELDVTNFNTSNVTVMAAMFSGCGLTELDLSGFNTAKVTAMDYMFHLCGNLKTIYVGDDWTTDSVETSDMMFAHCTSLVGGEGTTINSSYVDKTYARVDGGPSNPGYFTAK